MAAVAVDRFVDRAIRAISAITVTGAAAPRHPCRQRVRSAGLGFS